MDEIEALLKRAERADQKRAAVSDLMREIYRYFMPERDHWNSYGIGQDRSIYVYDSTGVATHTNFANRLHSAVWPAGQRWAELGLPAALLSAAESDELRQLKADLEAVTQIMFHHVHAGNFDAEINPVCYDIGAGVGAMLVQNGRRVSGDPSMPLLQCQAVPPAMLSFDDGPFGTVEGVFFAQEVPGRNLNRLYPDASLPAELARAIAENPEADVKVKQCTTFDAAKGDWRMQVIHEPTKTRLADRRYRTNPWIIIRWSRLAGETHGRGVLAQALPDTRTANKLLELMLIAGDFDADPTYTAVDDGVINTDVISVLPGQIIPVRSNGGATGPSLAMLPRPANLQFSDALLQQMHTRQRQLLFDHPLPPEVQVGLTATEIIERIRLYQQQTGSFGRLHHDGVNPLVLRFVDILEEAGEFPAPRFAGVLDLLRSRRAEIRVVSPIARAQDQVDQQQLMSVIAGLSQLGPFGQRILLAAVNPERAGAVIAQRAGIPATVVPTKAETDGRLRAEQEAQQQAMLATSPVAAQVAGAVASGAMNGGQATAPERLAEEV